AAVLAAFAWYVRRARTTEDHDLTFALTVTAMLLLSPISWDHYLLLFLTPFAIWWTRVAGSDSLRPAFLGLVFAWTLDPTLLWQVLIPGIRQTPGGGAGPLHPLPALSFPCYLNLACFIFGIALCRASQQKDLPVRIPDGLSLSRRSQAGTTTAPA